MDINKDLLKRANSVCELCSSSDELDIFKVEPKDEYIVVCKTCLDSLNNPNNQDINHWRCLNDSMWSEVPAVKVMAYRILKSISSEGWPQDMLDMLYLEEEIKEWAEDMKDESLDTQLTLDSNSTVLNSGDSVTIIKDLDVKGACFTAKRGTVVKNISLTDNPEQIEGRVNGVKIVLLSKFLKKV